MACDLSSWQNFTSMLPKMYLAESATIRKLKVTASFEVGSGMSNGF